MRRTLVALTTILAASSFALASQLPLGQPLGQPPSDPSFPQPGAFAGIDRPVTQDGPVRSGGATLAEALTIDRKAGVWWDYARDVSSVTARLSARGAKDTTILVPVDSAIMRLPRKPHQSPDGDRTEETMKKNVEKFLSAHIIPGSIDLPMKEPAQTLLDGLQIQVVPDDVNEGKWKVQPGDIPVLSVKQASNGRILYLDGVISS